VIYNGKESAYKKLFFDEETIKNPHYPKEIINEILSLNKAKYESIPQFYGIIKRKKGYGLLFQYFPGVSLDKKYQTLNTKEKLRILIKLCEILEFLHNKRLYHRDLKPDNLLISDDLKVFLLDFGLCKIAKHTVTFSQQNNYGCAYYMAPEIFSINENETMKISSKIDIWSLGCIMSEIFSNVIPWTNVVKSKLKVQSKLVNKEEFPIPKEIQYIEIIDALKRCLIINTDERINATDLKNLLIIQFENL